MKILYLGYWSVLDGLSESTIKPALRVLSTFPQVESVIYVSIERFEKNVNCSWSIPGITHLPFYSAPKMFLLDKVHDYYRLPRKLVQISRKNRIDLIICRGAPAGSIGYLIWRKARMPYIVESFEPHADYMLEGGVWNRRGIKYQLQKYLEEKQKKTAAAILTVSNNYRDHLLKNENLKTTVEVVPCTVDLSIFKFNTTLREKVRGEYQISNDTTVGIYTGKFGDIYYEDETFQLFAWCAENFRNFFLFILTPDSEEYISGKLEAVNLPDNKCWFGRVQHLEVPHFLSAADFAFCPVKPSGSRRFCSPVKNGEYWANGLPVLITEDIGDDSEIVKNRGCGIVLDMEKPQDQGLIGEIEKLVECTNTNRNDNSCVQIAKEFRDGNLIEKAYKKVLFK